MGVGVLVGVKDIVGVGVGVLVGVGVGKSHKLSSQPVDD